ncbi:MAG TPA: hypothetical protein ENN45_04320 [Bacteroidetes bacterium]|nr:hypothetical protein [Bacteroidota bacterium]
MAGEDIIKARVVFDTSNLDAMFGRGGGSDSKTTSPALAMNKVFSGFGMFAFHLKNIGSVLNNISNTLKEASPMWKASTDILKKSFMIFMRPFGDALSMLFRPVFLLLLRMSVAFLKWFHSLSPEEKKTMGIGAGAGAVGGGVAGFLIGGPIGASIGVMVGTVIGGLIGVLGAKIGEALANLVLWLGGKLKEYLIGVVKFFEGLKDYFGADTIIGKFFSMFQEAAIIGLKAFITTRDIMISILNLDFGKAWDLLLEFGQHLFDHLVNIFNTSLEILVDIGEWLWNLITDFFGNSIESMSDIGEWLWTSITKSLSGIKSFGKMIYEAAKAWLSDNIDKLISKFLPSSDKEEKVNDAIITPSGKIIRTNPQDYIIATKTPQTLGGGNNNITININALDSSSIDQRVLKKIQDAVESGIVRSLSGRTSQIMGV